MIRRDVSQVERSRLHQIKYSAECMNWTVLSHWHLMCNRQGTHWASVIPDDGKQNFVIDLNWISEFINTFHYNYCQPFFETEEYSTFETAIFDIPSDQSISDMEILCCRVLCPEAWRDIIISVRKMFWRGCAFTMSCPLIGVLFCLCNGGEGSWF